MLQVLQVVEGLKIRLRSPHLAAISAYKNNRGNEIVSNNFNTCLFIDRAYFWLIYNFS